MKSRITHQLYQTEKEDTRLKYSVTVPDDEEDGKDFEPITSFGFQENFRNTLRASKIIDTKNKLNSKIIDTRVELNSKNRSGYSKILKEIRDSLRFLECYSEDDTKIYTPCNKNLNINIESTNELDRDSIYLCIKTIVEDGLKRMLSQHEIFNNVNKYIDILNNEQLIDEEYYKDIKFAEKTTEKYDYLDNTRKYRFFLSLIFEVKDSVVDKRQQESKTKIYYKGKLI